jgi:hypothetical protein
MKNLESKLQISCMKWFSHQYSKYDALCFAVPNGGKRGVVTASIMKAEGVKSGVADVLLLVPNGLFNGLCIEFKIGKVKQSTGQKEG